MESFKTISLGLLYGLFARQTSSVIFQKYPNRIRIQQEFIYLMVLSDTSKPRHS